MNPFLRLKEKDKIPKESKRIKLDVVTKVPPTVPQTLQQIVPQIVPQTVPQTVPENLKIEPTVAKPLYIDMILQKITEYIKGNSTKILVLEGHPGIGKTYALQYIAQQENYLIDTYEDDTDIQEFIFNENLNGYKRLPIIDYIESFDLGIIHKYLPQLILKRAIITTLNVYDSNLYKWKNQIEIIRFKNYTNKELATILKTNDKALLEQSKGDLRYAQIMQQYAFQYTNQDVYYDLFGTTRNGIVHCNVSGVQSKDLFLLMSMLQQNSPFWSLNIHRSLDAFCNIDLQERELPSENLCDYLNCILEAFSCKKVSTIEMPKVPNTLKMSRCLRCAVPNASNVLDQHDTLNCLRLVLPPKITKSSEYYHENTDVRQILKTSPFNK